MMATALSDIRQASEADEFNEECSGKKKSKFKTFKNFFAKKKRTDTAAPRGENGLKQCQSSSNVSIPEPSAAPPDSETGSQSSIGNRAVSHDSIFIPELSISETAAARVTSQENVPGRVKALQLQLQQNIRLASPGVLISTKKTDDAGTLSEDDGLPRSPPEISSLHAILRCSTPKPAALVERHSSLSLGGTESEDEEQICSKPSSRPLSPLSPLVFMTTSSDSLPVDFSSPATPFACLDNSAARHKIAVNPRRHKLLAKQMKPTIREYSGSPKIPKLILLESKDEKNRITTSAGDLQGENGAEIDLLPQSGDSKAETNGEEFAENISKSSKMLEVSNSHSPEPEATCDGKSKGQNGDVLPNLPMQVTFDSEKVTTSENAHDSEKLPNIQGLSQGTIPMHKNDFNSTSVKSCMEDKEDTEYSSPMPPMAITESMECSENNYQDKDGENATFENTGDLLPPSADKPPTEESTSVAMHTEGNAKGNSPNTMQHSPTSEQMKGKSSVAPSGETSHSFKEKEGQEENISTDGSIIGGAGVKSLLNHRAEYEQTSSDELTDNIGFASDIPHEDLIIHYDPSTPQLLCSQGQAELSTPGEPLQKDNRLVNQGSIKFSIASAWQRSLLEANRKNECLDTDSSPLTAQQSENYETISEENGNEVLSSQNVESSSKYQRFLNQPLKMKSNSTESNSADNSCLQNVVNQQTKTGLNTKENPFGVKLRRISPLHKISSEGNFEQKVADSQQSMGIIPCTGTQTPVPEISDAGARGQAEAASMSRMEKDIGKRATKLSPESHKLRYRPAGKADSMEASTEFATQEKYSTARGKSERKESQTQLDFGPAPDNASTGVGSSEPVWVSMARQKQKGFHGQYSGTQDGTQPLENKFVVQMDTKKEATNALWEKTGNKNPLPSFQNKEMNISVKEEDQSKTKSPLGPGSHLQPKQQACGMGMRERRPMPNVKIAPLATGEPPWLAIAKKKAKAWSDMPQTVQ